MDTLKLNSFEAALAPAMQVGILLPQNPSLDAMAAALSLSLSLANSGKKAEVFCVTPPSVGLSSLVGVNKVKQQVNGSSNGLIISLPYKQGAIEKISYDIVGERINLTVVPGQDGLSFTTDDISYEMPSAKMDLFVGIGIASENDIASFYPAALETTLVTLDYKENNGSYGNVSLIDRSYSSYSEMVAKLLTTLSFPIDSDIAQNLLSGIVSATENFQSEITSPFAFEMVGLLMQRGARRMVGPTSFPKDAFFEEEEQKAVQSPRPWNQGAQTMPRRQQNFPPKRQPFPKPTVGIQQQPQMNQTPVVKQQQDNNGRAKTDSGKAPKDWFEPKIYRGSTPLSDS